MYRVRDRVLFCVLCVWCVGGMSEVLRSAILKMMYVSRRTVASRDQVKVYSFVLFYVVIGGGRYMTWLQFIVLIS